MQQNDKVFASGNITYTLNILTYLFLDVGQCVQKKIFPSGIMGKVKSNSACGNVAHAFSCLSYLLFKVGQCHQQRIFARSNVGKVR